MESSIPTEVKLTNDMIDYIRRSAIQFAAKGLPKHLERDDIAQHVLQSFVNRPPKFDPSRGTTLKTFVYGVVERVVSKYAVPNTATTPRLGQRTIRQAR